MENMIGMKFELNENNSYHLKVKPFNAIMTYGIYNQRNVTSTLFVSIVQTYSYFYQLIISENIGIENSEVFNFMFNANNNVGKGIEDAIKIYLSELQIRKKKSIIISIVLIIVIFVLHLFLYFLIKVTYIKIIQRKLSYISIFYDISLNFIKSAMIKCERFINKTNPNELLIIQEKNENYDDSMSFSNYEDDFELKNAKTKKNNKNNNKVNEQIDKKIKFEDVTENRVFTIKFIFILLFSLFYLIIILWLYMTLINNIEIIGFYIYYTQHYHNNFLNLFLAFRQFVIFKDSEMYNMKVADYLSYAEREIYQTFTSDITFLSENSNKISGLTKIFSQIQKNKLCSKDSEIEISIEGKCDYYMETITSLGFYNFLSFWVEEIRIKKNYILSLNNDLLKGIRDEKKIIYYFNNPEILPDINYMFIYAIIPYINKERNAVIRQIMLFISSKFQSYIFSIIIFFVLYILVFILFWRPTINKAKNLIKKTKNMFSIIPVEILAAQTNIKNLLCVSDLND